MTNPTLHEGALHIARQRIISNRSLLKNADRSGLPQYVQSRPFTSKAWLPPNFRVFHPPKSVVADEEAEKGLERPVDLDIIMGDPEVNGLIGETTATEDDHAQSTNIIVDSTMSEDLPAETSPVVGLKCDDSPSKEVLAVPHTAQQAANNTSTPASGTKKPKRTQDANMQRLGDKVMVSHSSRVEIYIFFKFFHRAWPTWRKP